MIKISGNDIRRGGEKIGWIQGNDVYNHRGEKAGYFTSNDIYGYDGIKVGYVEGNHIYSTKGGSPIRLDENRRQISGGSASDLTRAAVRLLLGE